MKVWVWPAAFFAPGRVSRSDGWSVWAAWAAQAGYDRRGMRTLLKLGQERHEALTASEGWV